MQGESERLVPSQATTPAAVPEVDAATFQESFGESLLDTLNLDTWHSGEDLAGLYDRLAAEVDEAVKQERRVRGRIRDEVFPRLATRPNAPKGAGVYRVRVQDLEQVHRCLLFNGGVEACDGTQQVHDTLPLTIFQVGVALVSYNGEQGSWMHRLFRRDLRMSGIDPTEEALELLERREQRGGLNQESRKDATSELARRGIMAYAERAILLGKSSARWRMGHGNPIPYELLTGSGSLDLMVEATKVLYRLLLDHQRFVFVPSEPSERLLLTIGQALDPLEFAIVDTMYERMRATIQHGHYRMKLSVDTGGLKPQKWVENFWNEVGPKVVIGVYRASRLAPPQVFYAHVEHADAAALLAMADSVLQDVRGFPVLIDLADAVCRSTFGMDALSGPLQVAYTDANAALEFLSERTTRRQ